MMLSFNLPIRASKARNCSMRARCVVTIGSDYPTSFATNKVSHVAIGNGRQCKHQNISGRWVFQVHKPASSAATAVFFRPRDPWKGPGDLEDSISECYWRNRKMRMMIVTRRKDRGFYDYYF